MYSKADLFLSYRRSDLDSVTEVRRALEARGVRTFLDRENLDAGQPWPEELEEALERTAAVAVFVGRDDLGSWQRREVWFALDRQVDAEQRGERFPVIPVLLPGARPKQSFLFANTWVDLTAGAADPRAVDAIVAALRGREAAPAELPDVCPYRGLEPFRFEDSPFFHGREAFSRQLLDQVLTRDLVAVVGPSGSGKSSVVQAGLLPELARHPEGRTWETATFRPGERPFEGLGDALMPLLEPGLGQRQLLKEGKALGDDLEAGEIRLEKVVDRLLENSGGSRGLLLVCDQFEELFRETPEERRLPFVEALLGASADSRLRLVITLRADFYEHLLRTSRELAERLPAGQVNLGPLSEEELERAILEPARRVGLTFEPGLVATILKDLRGNPGALPLLEFCLLELYENREGRRLTHAGYQAVGGVEGAVAGRADRTLAALTADQRRAARRLFGSLVRLASPGEGGNDTRRRVDLADVVPRELAERFVEARLLVTGHDAEGKSEWVEIAHEALIGSWRQLRAWLDEDKEFLLWRQRLHYAAGATGAAPRGRALSEARHWRRERREELTEAERKLIRSGTRRRAARIGLAALAILAVAGWSARAWLKDTRLDEIGKELDVRGDAEHDSSAETLLRPPWPLRSADVAEVLEKKTRLGGMLDRPWRQDEPGRLLEMVAAARPVLVREEPPHEVLGRSLWMLDYLAATNGDEEISNRAARLGADLRDDLRRVHGSPGSDLEPELAVMHPAHLRPYRLQVHEVTNLEFSRFDRGRSYDPGGDTLPVTGVSWSQAYTYAAWLGGRLPTEAEWEYAATGGCAAASGYCKRVGQGLEEADLGDLAWYRENSGGHPHPVMEKGEANQNGLYDIYGNVWEWVADWYRPEEPGEADGSPWGAAGGDERVIRGGCFADELEDVRPAERKKLPPGAAGPILGFRVLLPAPPASG